MPGAALLSARTAAVTSPHRLLSYFFNLSKVYYYVSITWHLLIVKNVRNAELTENLNLFGESAWLRALVCRLAHKKSSKAE